MTDTNHDIKRGTHTPTSVSPSIKAAGKMWIERCKKKKLERSTLAGYEQGCELHINPFIGLMKLANVTTPILREFADDLDEAGRSPARIERVMSYVGAIFREARGRGLASNNPVADLDLDTPDRDDPRPVFPTKPELQAIIGHADGRNRPLVLVATFCGLRASELRGLRWRDVSFNGCEISINQRADHYHTIGKCKSKAAYRTIPAPPIVMNALREWKLVCPKGKLDLVFPTGAGGVESYSNIRQRSFDPLQVSAGVVNEDGEAKYGLHALRHACAVLWIEQGHNPKQIQRLMGHSSIQQTYDTYGYLFDDAEADQKAANAIQVRLLGR